MREVRTDIHRPTTLVTENYEIAGYLDFVPPMPTVVGPNANGQYFTIPVPREIMAHRTRMLSLLELSTEHHRENGQCDHCGARIRYTAIMTYLPTGGHISVGEQCLDNRFERATDEFQSMRKQAALDRQQQRIKHAVAEYCLANPDLAWMASMQESWVKVGLTEEGGEIPGRRPNFFVLDVSHKLRKYGEISERQADAVRASLAKDAEWTARRAAWAAEQAAAEAAAPPAQTVPNGRQVVTGEVITTKEVEGNFGWQSKMLVKDDRGFKIWTTRPSSLIVDRGDRVSFSAELERSKDDQFFGFGKRPTQAKRLGPVAIVAQ